LRSLFAREESHASKIKVLIQGQQTSLQGKPHSPPPYPHSFTTPPHSLLLLRPSSAVEHLGGSCTGGVEDARQSAGNKREAMLERMMRHFNASLDTLSPAEHAEEWASVHIEVGRRIAALPASTASSGGAHSRGAAIEAAIWHYETALGVLDTAKNETYCPAQLAEAKAALGAVLGERKAGSRGDNLEAALVCFRDALALADAQSQPLEWARIHLQMAEGLVSRIHGDRSRNLEEAAAACNAALSVFTAEKLPEMWARAQGTLGWICSSKTTGDRHSNTQRLRGEG
jgi:hypothetical protein